MYNVGMEGGMKKILSLRSMTIVCAVIAVAVTVIACGGSSGEKTADKAAKESVPTALETFPLEEATIAGLQDMMSSGQITSEKLVTLYIDRIDRINQGGPRLNAVIQKNPDALAIAREMDRERKEKGPRGPLSLRSRSSSRAMARASGFFWMTALSRGPPWSIRSMRSI